MSWTEVCNDGTTRTSKNGPNQWWTIIGHIQSTPPYDGHPCHDCDKPTTGDTHCAPCRARNNKPGQVTTMFGSIVLRNVPKGIDRYDQVEGIEASMNRWVGDPDVFYQAIDDHRPLWHAPCNHPENLFDLLEVMA